MRDRFVTAIPTGQKKLFDYLFTNIAILANEFQELGVKRGLLGEGALLALNREQPHVLALMEIMLPEGEIGSLFRPLIVNAFDDLVRFIKIAYQKEPNLVETELSNMQQEVFDKNIHPINILKEKSPGIKYVIGSLESINLEMVNQIKTIGKNVGVITRAGLMMGERLVLKIEPMFDAIRKTLNEQESDFNIDENSAIEEVMAPFNKSMQDISDEIRIVNRSTKHNCRKIAALNKTLLLILGREPKDQIHSFLSLLKDCSALNLEFEKLVCRICFIVNNNHAGYFPELNINPVPYKSPKMAITKILNDPLMDSYPQLTEYLQSMKKYDSLRNIDAHWAPKALASTIKGHVRLCVPGKNVNIDVSITELKEVIDIFSIFYDGVLNFIKKGLYKK